MNIIETRALVLLLFSMLILWFFGYWLPRSGLVIISVLSVFFLYVGLYICQTITVGSLDVGNLFSHIRYNYLDEVRVKFIYEGHRVNIKVTGATKYTQSQTQRAHIW